MRIWVNSFIHWIKILITSNIKSHKKQMFIDWFGKEPPRSPRLCTSRFPFCASAGGSALCNQVRRGDRSTCPGPDRNHNESQTSTFLSFPCTHVVEIIADKIQLYLKIYTHAQSPPRLKNCESSPGFYLNCPIAKTFQKVADIKVLQTVWWQANEPVRIKKVFFFFAWIQNCRRNLEFSFNPTEAPCETSTPRRCAHNILFVFFSSC